jgi:crotonobetainyl-CoA:carnitine CoA-transferase CaiB-like acyl-CoA transferase
VEGTSALAAVLLSGVESVALDLKQPAGRKVLEALLGRADVMLDTFRPGTLRRLGLAPEDVAERFPRLVVCSLTGWGGDGPYAARAGHDLTYQALAGTLAPTQGLAAAPAVPVADLVGAWSVVASVLAALLGRGSSGRGTVVDASLFDAAAHANLMGWVAEAGGARAVGEALQLTGTLPCYHLYATSDGGFLALAALEPHFWKRFCAAVERPDLEKLQYRTEAEARRRVAALVASRSRAEWISLLAEHDIPAEPVLSAAEAREHPQMRARGVVSEEGRLPRLAFPARFDGERPRAGARVPDLGEHTAAVVAELDLNGGLPRRRAGVGKRFSLRRLLARWVGP